MAQERGKEEFVHGGGLAGCLESPDGCELGRGLLEGVDVGADGLGGEEAAGEAALRGRRQPAHPLPIPGHAHAFTSLSLCLQSLSTRLSHAREVGQTSVLSTKLSWSVWSCEGEDWLGLARTRT